MFTINNYIPESQVDTDTFNMFNSLKEDEKKENRKDLIECSKYVAKVDRIDKRMEKRLGG